MEVVCPKCGKPIQVVAVERDYTIFGCPEHREFDEVYAIVSAFVVYNKSGRPLAYYFRTDGEEISDEEMEAIMKLHPEATDNAETYIEWRETA